MRTGRYRDRQRGCGRCHVRDPS